MKDRGFLLIKMSILITCLNLFSNFLQKYTIFIFLFYVSIKHTLRERNLKRVVGLIWKDEERITWFQQAYQFRPNTSSPLFSLFIILILLIYFSSSSYALDSHIYDKWFVCFGFFFLSTCNYLYLLHPSKTKRFVYKEVETKLFWLLWVIY